MKEPRYKIGQLVKVYEFYADGDIVKDTYRGLILNAKVHEGWAGRSCIIYDILPNNRQQIETAEEYAIEEIAGV